jgi:AbiJ N-terminal domain 4
MPIYELFSKRRKSQSGELPDVYTYDIPTPLRVQIIHIWGDALGHPGKTQDEPSSIRPTYQFIVETLRREYGVFRLTQDTYDPTDDRYAVDELCKFFLEDKGISNTTATDKALDVIELTFRAIDRLTRSFSYLYRKNADKVADEAIDELNRRFKEHGIGYFYSDGIIGRIDSEFVHAKVVKPALLVLRQKDYENVQSEFLAAHEHYRAGKRSEAIVECYKAFESTMKIICTKRKWAFDKSKGAADLVRVCLDQGLIPPYWQTHFAGLRSVLESAIPTPRNKQAGHGAGAAPPQVPSDELVAYVLHMTAATILFLTEADRTLS